MIAGGGIGGLAATLALQQRGIPAIVCERAPELREVGAGLLPSPNAVHVLMLLGIADEAMARSRVITEWRILLSTTSRDLAALQRQLATSTSPSPRGSPRRPPTLAENLHSPYNRPHACWSLVPQ